MWDKENSLTLSMRPKEKETSIRLTRETDLMEQILSSEGGGG
jgi:Asp-tRNA(Asn)/Glu-tRNA(Gln) amidotransferase B subunit